MSRDVDSRHDYGPDRHDPGRPDPVLRAPEEPRELSRERELVRGRGYTCHISPDELETLREVGRFRTVAVDDLARYRYCGDSGRMRQDLHTLEVQNLLKHRTISTGGQGEKLAVVVLTKSGQAVVENEGHLLRAQQVYAGFVKPAEVAHDGAIYRMYQAEAAKIERDGGRIRRIVLDYEFKQKVYAPLAKAKALPPLEYARRQAEIARDNGLKVVHGKILLPDLRVEYEAANGSQAHVDLELATHHYRGSQMRDKAQAGFKMYAPQDSVARLTAAFDPEFAAEIFSF